MCFIIIRNRSLFFGWEGGGGRGIAEKKGGYKPNFRRVINNPTFTALRLFLFHLASIGTKIMFWEIFQTSAEVG